MNICLIGSLKSIHTRRYASRLVQSGFNIHVISEDSPAGGFPEDFSFTDLSMSFNIRKLRYFIWGFLTYKLISQIKPDLVHAIGASGAAWLGAAARYHPYIITATGSDLLLLKEKSWIHQQLTHWALGQSNYLIAVSQQLQDAAVSFDYPIDRIDVIHLGFDERIFNMQGMQQKELRSDNGINVLSLRSIKEVYNPLVIAHAIPYVIEVLPKVKFLIPIYNADLVLFQEFRKIIDDLNLTQSVIYLPALLNNEEIANILHQADITISIARSDGTPVSILESMACGNALIVGDISATKKLLIEEETGIFVPIDNPTKLGQAIIRLVKDTNLRKRLGERASSEALNHFSDREQFQKISQLYQRIKADHG